MREEYAINVYDPTGTWQSGKKVNALLRCDEKGNSTLEISHINYEGFKGFDYSSADVLFGITLNGIDITLLNVEFSSAKMDNQTIYTVEMYLIGALIESLDVPFFNKCTVFYPYLRNWAKGKSYSSNYDVKNNVITLGGPQQILNAAIDDNVSYVIYFGEDIKFEPFSVNINHISTLSIRSGKGLSINDFLGYVSEFSQFLSIVLLERQRPNKLIFYHHNDIINRYELTFNPEDSYLSHYKPLIDFETFQSRLSSFLVSWHHNYEQLAPICKYLIDSFRSKKAFDAPDFLIIAQALDGYFKRFENKKDGIDTRKLKDEIAKLLEIFNNVDAITDMNLAPDIVADTRDKYSHLIPDEEFKNKKAVSGENLYWLTEKCKLLLICCLLNNIGLTNNEINQCINRLPLKRIINYQIQ